MSFFSNLFTRRVPTPTMRPDAPRSTPAPRVTGATKTSAAGLAIIKQHEGFRGTAYLCPAGVWTLGYGTTKGIRKGMTATREQAEALLRDDVAQFEAAVLRAVKQPLSQNQFDALVSFTYNVGAGAFAASTMVRLINAGEWGAAADQFSRWTKGGGRVLPGLTKRRAAERALFLRP